VERTHWLNCVSEPPCTVVDAVTSPTTVECSDTETELPVEVTLPWITVWSSMEMLPAASTLPPMSL